MRNEADLVGRYGNLRSDIVILAHSLILGSSKKTRPSYPNMLLVDLEAEFFFFLQVLQKNNNHIYPPNNIYYHSN